MKTVAIISEYNPFHFGHLHQVNEIKKIFNGEPLTIISIMSGNFIQRGEPSILNKFKRCESVIKNGINLCLEIPIHFSLSSAEGFALGVIELLDKLNIVDYLCFGCESPDEKKLNLITDFIISSDKNVFKKYLDLGLSFPKARELIIKEQFNDNNLTNFVKLSNNILAVEYLKSIKILNSKIKILPIQRLGGNYNDENLDENFSSATSIRNVILNANNDISNLKNHVPNSTYEILNKGFRNNEIVCKEQMFPYIKYKLLTFRNLDKIEDVSEGLENKFYSSITRSNNLNELILNVKSKRYTYSRLSRILTKYFVGFENFTIDEIKNFNNYVRVLGFDKVGMETLNKIKKVCPLAIISKFNKKNSSLAPLDILGTKAYSLLNKNLSPLDDFKNPPIIIL